MASPVKFYCYPEDKFSGLHAFGTDTIKVALTNTLPDETVDELLADLTEIAATGGYAAGGYSLGVITVSRAGADSKVVIPDKTITASGGSVGPFRYYALQNSSKTGGPLISFFDNGSSITLADGESILLDFDGTNGAITDSAV